MQWHWMITLSSIYSKDMFIVDHVHHSIISSKMIALQAVFLFAVGIASTSKSRLVCYIWWLVQKISLLGYVDDYNVKLYIVR